MTTTPNPTPEVQQAQEVVRLAEAVQTLAEGVRAHRAGGPDPALTLVLGSDPHVREFVAAALNMVRTLAEHLCESTGDDVDSYLAEWLAQADRDDRAARAHLAELTEGGGDQ